MARERTDVTSILLYWKGVVPRVATR